MHEAHDLSSIQLWKSEDDNPYIKAWWKWWPHIKDGLIRLRIT